MPKPPPLGNVNPAFSIILYKGKKPLGICLETPNSMAYGFAVLGATYAKNRYRRITKKEVGLDRIKAKGWFPNDREANLKRL